jgi:hypothetical protein
MSSSRSTPKDTVKVRRRLPKVGEEIMIRAIVTRTGRNRLDTADTITVRIADHPAPVTATAKYLLGEAED